jgi:preprotein translocase subunit SecG
MSLLIGLFTIILVLVCVILVLLVIIQLPKKEAGLGVAFGGAAADALFGPGTGTILTKATKYLAILFFVLCLSLTGLHMKAAKRERLELLKATTSQDITPQTGSEKTIPGTPLQPASEVPTAPQPPIPTQPPQQE